MNVIISGGGTGGHIFPAISIANAIRVRFPDSKILFVGAKDRMEMKRVPTAGYEIVGLEIAGFDRKNIFKNILVLWKLFKSMLLARKIVKQFKPDVAIGVGGYASGATLRVASWLDVPTVLVEQNSYPGITNKLLAKKAHKICVGYEGMDVFFDAEKIVLTGTPCRQDLTSPTLTEKEAYDYFQLDPTKKTLLIIGGSLGSKTLNYSVMSKLDEIIESGINVIWQCGEIYKFEVSVALANRLDTSNIRVFDFLTRMDLSYKIADLVISRAGAGSIAELAMLAKPTILVPSPNVAEDHQTKNAQALVDRQAAILVADKDAGKYLIDVALDRIADDNELKLLANNISKLAQHNSADRIVDEILKVIKDNE